MIEDEKLRKFKCDACQNLFRGAKRLLTQEFHFCSRACVNESQKKDGILWKRNRERMLEKHGVPHVLSLPSVREKAVTTCMQKYGVSNPSQAETVKKRKSQTSKETFTLRGKEIKERRMKTNTEKYGVPWATMTPEVREKAVSTFKRKYGEGVKCAMDIREVVEKTDFVSAAIKRHETMKKNKTYKTSKPEESVYRFLCEKYGEENVERQAVVRQWPIDFYIKNINTYVQVDGDYWHGKHRTFDELENSSSARDKVILRKKKTDAEQDAWFEKHSMKLVRISEYQVKRGDFEV